MRTIFTVILSSIILFKSVGFTVGDIFQLDDFIEHAQYHNTQYGDTFFEFVSKHYGELKSTHEKEHQEEREDHEKLPCQQTVQVASTIFFIQSSEIKLNTIEYIELRDVQFHYTSSTSSLHSQKFLQPPRLS